MLNKEKWENIREKLNNYSEEIILSKMQELFLEKNIESCTCSACILDIATYVLNRLPAKYISSSIGNIYTRISEYEEQYQADILSNLVKAIQIVAENPSVDCERINNE